MNAQGSDMVHWVAMVTPFIEGGTQRGSGEGLLPRGTCSFVDMLSLWYLCY